MLSKKLRLSRESLGELASDELRSVAGGSHLTCPLTDDCTHGGIVVGSLRLDCHSLDPAACFGYTRQLSCGCQPTDGC